MRTIYFDGQYQKVDIQIIEAFAPGSLKAKGVFETMLGLDGVVLDTALHIKRLRHGLKILDIEPPTINPLVLKEVFHMNQLSFGRVRLMVWQSGKKIHMMVVALPYKPSAKKFFRVGLIKTNRMANDKLSEVKSLDYELFSRSYAKAQAQGLDEVLLRNRQGYIFEASRANIFWIKDKVLHTPPLTSGCLNGITRQHVLKQAKSLKLTTKEMDLTPDILSCADAAFLTNSLIGIKPIEINKIRNISSD